MTLESQLKPAFDALGQWLQTKYDKAPSLANGNIEIDNNLVEPACHTRRAEQAGNTMFFPAMQSLSVYLQALSGRAGYPSGKGIRDCCTFVMSVLSPYLISIRIK